ncbi:hypothetical protein ACHAWC_003954 [Mediolabrus comicus]
MATIGGPGTRLPFVVESFLGWSLCISCLTVSGYHYVKSVTISSALYRRVRRLVRSILGGWLITKSNRDISHEDLVWIPLTTHSRSELSRQTPWERYLSLVQVLERRYPDALLPILPPERSLNEAATDEEGRETISQMQMVTNNIEDIETIKRNADDVLVHALRHDDVCRRLASLAMRPYHVVNENDSSITTAVNSVGMKANGTDANNLINNKLSVSKRTSTATIQTTLLEQLPHNRLLQRMSKMWKYLLILPSLKEAKAFYRIPTNAAEVIATKRGKRHESDAHYPYQISIIMPAFHEKGSHLLAKLSNALEASSNPDEVEVIIVDAGGCTGLEEVVSLNSSNNEKQFGEKGSHLLAKLSNALEASSNPDEVEVIIVDAGGCTGLEEVVSLNSSNNEKQFGKISIISFTSGGGRGPCLNYGGYNATGKILTFCHSDTTLPRDWDTSIVSTLEHDGLDDDDLFRMGKIRANSCAFSFGIDTSPAGLAMPFTSSSQLPASYFPPGIRAVETTANLRTHLYSLPYGDQVLSLHAAVFHFLGGFPDQCLMEDYELISLLRRRAALLDGVYPNGRITLNRVNYERLAIVPGPPALCSPRRWQKFGVIYTTYTNSRLVNLYAGGMGADELFQLYYSRDPPKRSHIESPWELELREIVDYTTLPKEE